MKDEESGKRKAESGKQEADVQGKTPLSAFRFPFSDLSLNVIGCGRVGRTLARLWTRHRVFQVRAILNRTLQSGGAAAEFVGAGHPVGSSAELEKADLVMISAPDEAIEDCCKKLSVVSCRLSDLQSGNRQLTTDNCQLPTANCQLQGTIVFHCSGSLASSVLEPASAQGASIASLHPVKSFADPAAAAESFPGTFCAIEGDPHACAVLGDAVRRCGGQVFTIDPRQKTIYHAATVFASNYVVALMKTALECLEKSGVPRQTAPEILRPLAASTVSNVCDYGPVRALTGPIARGETSVVAKQCEALGQWDPAVLELYKTLGRVALDLAAAQGTATPEALAAIRRLLHQ